MPVAVEQRLDAEIVVAVLEEHAQARVEQAMLRRMHGFHGHRRSRSPLDAGLRTLLASDLLDHVLDDVAVLVLRTEHHDLRVGVDPDVVAGRPVEQVTRLDGLRRRRRASVVVSRPPST